MFNHDLIAQLCGYFTLMYECIQCSSNGITSEGAVYIGESLAKLKNLTSLELGFE